MDCHKPFLFPFPTLNAFFVIIQLGNTKQRTRVVNNKECALERRSIECKKSRRVKTLFYLILLAIPKFQFLGHLQSIGIKFDAVCSNHNKECSCINNNWSVCLIWKKPLHSVFHIILLFCSREQFLYKLSQSKWGNILTMEIILKLCRKIRYFFLVFVQRFQ